MKKAIFTLAMFGILAAGTNATVRTVSNDPKAPAQYTSINTAVQEASNGDTIMVYGSATTYGSVTIDRKIVLIGAGYNNPYGNNSLLDYLYLNGNGALSASHSKISGFIIRWNVFFNGINGASDLIEGLLIERCWMSNLRFDDNGVTYRDDTIRNCLFVDSYFYFYWGNYENIQIHNCIFDNQYFNSRAGNSLDSVCVSKCTFVNRANPNTMFVNTLDLTIQNSIFYAAEPKGCSDCAFNNNMTYLNLDNQLDGTGNPGSVGSGNQEDVDPQFVIFPPAGGRFQYTHDLNVQNSLAIDGGIDGTDMGIHGGMLPYAPGVNPSIPQMTEITFPGNASTVKAGGTLDVTFKAKKQD